jgi:3-hydroxyacyl-CoA dehydrogenase
VNRIAIIGAGVMGSQIAALFAGAGFHVDLLDVSDQAAAAGRERLRALRPSPLYAAADLDAIHPGSLERPLPKADWYLEAAIEDLAVKRGLMARIEAEGDPRAVVSTNTSSLSVAAMAEGRSEAFRRRFIGVHFFNPPRYLPLVELIGDAPEAERILTTRLGKRVVHAKDTPGFIANRIGGAAIRAVLAAVEATGIGLDAADAITGAPLGRSRSGTFRTLDLVGLDTLQRIEPNLPGWIQEMVRRGWVGEKAGQGFYKRQGGEILVIDPGTLEYRPRQRVRVTEPMEVLAHTDPFAWACLAPVLRFAAASVPEAADSPQQIDDAMRWGYGWSLGPFEAWDRIGFRKAAARMRAEGGPLPPLAESLEADGFYAGERVWAGTWIPRRQDPRDLDIREAPAVWRTADADLRDLGGGVACIHLHPDHDALGPATVAAIRRAAEEVGGSSRWRALVLLGPSAERFSVGANLQLMLFAAEEEDWAEVDRQIRAFQETTMALRHLDRPVVAALAGMALGGGCELCLHADRIQAAAESYVGLVEPGAGLIPAGGGCKELVRRSGGNPRRIAAALETVGQARVSESARHARELGYLTAADGISLDAGHRLADARDAALLLADAGYAPPRADETFPVLGRDGWAALMLAVQEQRWAGRISDYDAEVGAALATVLTGGDLPAGSRVRAQHILDLERETFLKLLRHPLTQARMRHLLQTGRPLRN